MLDLAIFSIKNKQSYGEHYQNIVRNTLHSLRAAVYVKFFRPGVHSMIYYKFDNDDVFASSQMGTEIEVKKRPHETKGNFGLLV